MSELIFGIDFGTTNSLAALVIGDEVRAFTEDGKPHPSVVWYRGTDVIVGREARRHLESTEGGVAQGFIRSPKMRLRREGMVYVEGRAIAPADIVSEVLGHLRERTASQRSDYDISRAVMTIPVDFAGPQRRALRSAARKAGIGIVQFVHEPAAALYSFLRSKVDFRRELARFENRVILVFDWGGGTLDLTACRVLGGVVMQMASRGNNEIGGDQFDERLRNLIRDRHAASYGISDIHALEQPGVAATLLTQCELAKIQLSTKEQFRVIVRDYLRADGSERNLGVDLTRFDLEQQSRDLVNRGLSEIDRLLDEAHLDRRDVEICIATGGMVNMPAIWNGLVERFGARVPALPNRDTIIAEGAAWIANDGLRLTLAKPIEVLVAEGNGRGTYLPVLDAGAPMPVENEVKATPSRRFFCVDPRDGVAVFEFAKPRKVGLLQAGDERATMHVLNLPVDSGARPFLERLECEVQLDHDYVARVSIISKLRGGRVEAEIHDLDFGLTLPEADPNRKNPADDGSSPPGERGRGPAPKEEDGDGILGAVALRANIANIENWKLIPGDIVEQWQPNFWSQYSKEATQLQREERMYYERCSYCDRTLFEIQQGGPVDMCFEMGCPEERAVKSKKLRTTSDVSAAGSNLPSA
jgi:actin-like ATPase involved in cell morphogenesis